MKKIIQIILVAIILRPHFSLCQVELYGTTNHNPTSNGVLCKFKSITNELTKATEFKIPDGNPTGDLVKANNGKYYGVTTLGGSNAKGVIYSFDKNTNTKTAVYSFDNLTGIFPEQGMIKASNGKLYGVTREGGLNDNGVLFSFNTINNAYTVLWEFDTVFGFYPKGKLTQALGGLLYGVTSEGGTGQRGTIYSYNISNNSFAVEFNFSNAFGGNPQAGLTNYNDTLLFGTTIFGGSTTNGSIFSFNINTHTAVGHSGFNYTDGYACISSLLKASNGLLYGTAVSGGGSSAYGTLFSYNPLTSIKTVLYNFNKAVPAIGDPNGLIGSLVQGNNGKLYGVTQYGGGAPTFDGGTIFSFDIGTNAMIFYNSFSITGYPNGKRPYGSLTLDANGKLYGVTYSGGGLWDFGTIYSFDPTSQVHTKLSSFSSPDGHSPNGSLTKGNDGIYYGVTRYGGTYNYGTIYTFDPATSTFTTIKDIEPSIGKYPIGAMMKADNGKFYGITEYGGLGQWGTLFFFDPVTNTTTKLLDLKFNNDLLSADPSLMQASNKKIYVMGLDTTGDFAIFSYNIDSNLLHKVYKLNSFIATSLRGGLCQAPNGLLYGFESGNNGGSSNFGSIFYLDPQTDSVTKFFNFDSINGKLNTDGLILASDGKMYATTMEGGIYNMGTLFSVDPSSNTMVKLHDFDSISGKNPIGKLLQASDGKLYGSTFSGGANNLGTVFSFDITNKQFIKLTDFNSSNGLNPTRGVGFIEHNNCSIVPATILASGSLNLCNSSTVTLSANKVGNALSMTSGGNKYVSVPHAKGNNLGSSTTFTIEAWVYVTDNENNTVVDKGDYGYLFQTHPNGHTGLGFKSKNFGWIYSTGTIPIKQWVHVAVTYSNKKIKFYQNGVLKGSFTTPFVALGDTGIMNIGREAPSTCGCNNMNGSIDELRLWKVARTQAEIQASMKTNVDPNSTGLTAYYKFDDNAGPYVKDATIDNNYGTLANGVEWQVPSTSPVGYSSYMWSTGATTSSITVGATATYTVTVTNALGCTSSTTAAVAQVSNPTVTITPASASLCNSTIPVQLSASGTATSYTWSPGGSLNATKGTPVLASPTTTTTYTVIGTNDAGCTSSATAKVTVNPKPTNLYTNNITGTTARANWDVVSCAVGYTLQYRKAGTTTWTTKQINTNTNLYNFAGLATSTAYNWRVKAKYINGGSVYSANQTFTTLPMREGEVSLNPEAHFNLYPNPSTGSITLEFATCNNCVCNISVYDVAGKLVFENQGKPAGNTLIFDLSAISPGYYQVKVQYNDNVEYTKLLLK